MIATTGTPFCGYADFAESNDSADGAESSDYAAGSDKTAEHGEREVLRTRDGLEANPVRPNPGVRRLDAALH